MKMESYYCRQLEIPFVFAPIEQISLRFFKKVLIAGDLETFLQIFQNIINGISRSANSWGTEDESSDKGKRQDGRKGVHI
jgi:hypothetical protein